MKKILYVWQKSCSMQFSISTLKSLLISTSHLIFTIRYISLLNHGTTNCQLDYTFMFERCLRSLWKWLRNHILMQTRESPREEINRSLPGQNGRHFMDDILRCIFVNETFCILIKISLKFVPQGSIHNDSALASIMAWRRIGGKALSVPMLIRFSDA